MNGGLELKLKRVRVGLTLWDLSQLCGVSAPRLCEMEKGRRPVSEAVEKVLDQILADTSVDLFG